MPSSLYVPILVAGMLVTGSSNSLWSKFQDMQCVENCDDPDPSKHRLYEQPVWQTLTMFIGEMLCFLPVIYTWLLSKHQAPSVQLPPDDDASPKPLPDAHSDLRGWHILLMWLPAACDLTGTTLMNIGLLYTPVSIFQMTRGALVLFVGILSVLFLRRRLWLYQWVALLTVMAGISLVGYSGSLIKDAVKVATFQSDDSIEDPQVTKVLVGVFFIMFAQIFTAIQFVVEEKIMARYSVAPLMAVGYEGFFGFLTIMLLLPILPLLLHTPSPTPSVTSTSSKLAEMFDLSSGWHQLLSTPSVLYSSLAIALSISLFNFFGLSVTRRISATARSVTDTCRTLSIWVVSLGLGWERVVWPVSVLQVAGFGLLVYGTFLFNNLVTPPRPLRPSAAAAEETPTQVGTGAQADEENRALLADSEDALDETAALPADLGQGGFDVVPPASAAHVGKGGRA